MENRGGGLAYLRVVGHGFDTTSMRCLGRLCTSHHNDTSAGSMYAKTYITEVPFCLYLSLF